MREARAYQLRRSEHRVIQKKKKCNRRRRYEVGGV